MTYSHCVGCREYLPKAEMTPDSYCEFCDHWSDLRQCASCGDMTMRDDLDADDTCSECRTERRARDDERRAYYARVL